ncbi:hypothetical protein N7510_004477 [Penicillium lagena]|uniref:uncharacterized protein n=1 Tax=Penicillium lagena TaxID=94218 RepID=UPI00253F9CAD|nr:uncharacterized protein N7510_004477 [Penicillium lagena]KAJ5620493.1 hypothetical protein N7510_004477 [Penicillium lagena]
MCRTHLVSLGKQADWDYCSDGRAERWQRQKATGSGLLRGRPSDCGQNVRDLNLQPAKRTRVDIALLA